MYSKRTSPIIGVLLALVLLGGIAISGTVIAGWWFGVGPLGKLAGVPGGIGVQEPWQSPNPNSPTGGGTGTGTPWYGNIEFKMDTQDIYDLTAESSNEPTVKIWGSTRNRFIPITLDGSTAAYFELRKEDAGKAWLVVDFGTTTTFFVNLEKTKEYAGYVNSWEPWDYDSDGILETAFALDFTSLRGLTAGESNHKLQWNIALVTADSAPTITSSTNASSISTSAYDHYYSTGYITVAAGKGIKINRVRLVYGTDASNDTYVEDTGAVKLMDISIGFPNADGSGVQSVMYSGAKIKLEDSNDRFVLDLGVNDLNNEYYGILMYRGRGIGDSGISYSVHILAKFPSASKTWYPYLEFTMINPASTLDSTTLKQYIQFAS